MKIRIGFFWIICVALAIGLLPVGCASKQAKGSGKTLDQAIAEAAVRIDERIERGTKIALLNFSSSSDRFSSYVLDELTTNLLDSGKLIVVDRKEIDLIRSEIDFQYSGELADESMQAVGRRLGAQSIVSGSLTEIGGEYRIVIRVLNVESATVVVQYRSDINSDRRVLALLEGGRATPAVNTQQRPSNAGITPITTTTQIAQPIVPPPPREYDIGDTGPAGGIIFYDKGNNSGGWRYLEAAPASSEFIARMGSRDRNMGLRTEVGSGKANTQSLKVWLEQQGEITSAPVRITQMNINGFTDWYLPSIAELGWLYLNLKERKLGGFGNGFYLSSSPGSVSNFGFGQRFSDGQQNNMLSQRDNYSIRAVRQF